MGGFLLAKGGDLIMLPEKRGGFAHERLKNMVERTRLLANAFYWSRELLKHDNPETAGQFVHTNMFDLADSIVLMQNADQSRGVPSFAQTRLKLAQTLVTTLAAEVGLQTLPRDVLVTDASDISDAVHFNAKTE